MNFFRRKSGVKFGNERRGCQLGHSHRSKLESAVCDLFYLRMKAKEIEVIEVEKHVRVCGPAGHICSSAMKVELVVDFKLTRKDGTYFYAEAKGFQTPEYRIKRRLWIHNNLGMLEVWGGSPSRLTVLEVIGL